MVKSLIQSILFSSYNESTTGADASVEVLSYLHRRKLFDIRQAAQGWEGEGNVGPFEL